MITPKSARTVEELRRRIGSAASPLMFDVRRRPSFETAERMIAGARYRPHDLVRDWGRALPAEAEIVVYCVHGHEVSQAACAALQAMGRKASYLEGGFEAWLAAGGATRLREVSELDAGEPSQWVTRERPKVDRIACPWLIRRFIDPEAVLHYVAPERLHDVARALGAIPFDVDGVEFSHDGELCSFDAFIARFGVDDPALRHMARIVRGADTARLDLEPQCAGLLALALGASSLYDSDQEALAAGMTIYDALYAWIRFARAEQHNWPSAVPAEKVLA